MTLTKPAIPSVSNILRTSITSSSREKPSFTGRFARTLRVKFYSAVVLYRKLLLRLKSDLASRKMDEKFIQPWSGKAAEMPLSMNELIDQILEKAGLKNTACLRPEVVTEMRCYALFSIIDPTIALWMGRNLSQFAKLISKGEETAAGIVAKGSLKIASRKQKIAKKMEELRNFAKMGTLSDEERYAKTKEISDLIAEELKSQGYKVTVFKYYVPGADPATNSYWVAIDAVPKGKDAATLVGGHQKLGVTYRIIPYLQAAEPNLLGRNIGGSMVILPVESVVNNSVGKTRTLLHEIKHAKLFKDLINGKPGPYYGRFTAADAERGIDLAGYQTSFSLEEMATRHRSLRQAQAGVRDAKPMGAPRSANVTDEALQLLGASLETPTRAAGPRGPSAT